MKRNKLNLLLVLTTPFLLVACKSGSNASGNGGNSSGGGSTPSSSSGGLGPVENNIAPDDPESAFIAAAKSFGRSFEYTLKDCDSETDEYMTIGFMYYDANNYNIYYIDSASHGTGWENYRYNLYCDIYDSGAFAEGQMWSDAPDSTTVLTSKVAQTMINLIAYFGQEYISATSTPTTQSVGGHACDKYSVGYMGENMNYYISKSLGFTLQCDYNDAEGSDYIYKLESFTSGSNPMVDVFG